MEHAEGVEERIVKKFISENCLELPINEHISAQGEVSIFRYFIDDEQGGQWKDGTITPYDHELQRWYRKPQAVKFFILGDEYNEPANKLELYKKTDELVQSGGSRSCMTPIFTTYNPKLKKMIICFPYFSEPFTKWIADYKGDGSVCLPGILKDMIRDLLVLMSKTSVMGLANPSSYICIRAKESPNNNNKYPNAGKREILKFIRFPLSGEDPNEHQMRTSFSAFLRTNLPREWLGRDFMLFLEMMETRGAVYSLQDVKEHPVLKCGDGITELIRACYRENLSPKQRGILDRIVNIANYGGQSWHTHLIVYPVLLAMSHYRTGLSDSYDLLWFSRKATAHYKENLNVALRSRTIQTCPFYNIHPSFIIMTLYPGLVSDLYKLYLNHEYLNAIV